MQLIPGLTRRQKSYTGTAFARSLSTSRTHCLAFSNHKLINSAHKGGILWLDLDPIEQRYLLSGSADSSVAVYDVLQPVGPGHPYGAPEGEYGAVLRIAKDRPDCHRYSVTSVAWYPVDTGLFVTGSFDEQVKVWDANTAQLACSFSFSGKVTGVAMSSIATSHCLVAVVGADPAVKLCDPATGGFMHSLVGHREAVWAVAWSMVSEHQLMTGSNAGQMRLWDIRTHRCLQILDQHHTQKPATTRATPRGRKRAVPSAAAQNATAHDGSITCITATTDGLHWLSAATDNKVRLWDTKWQRNLLVNYHHTWNSSMKARQMAAAADADMVFHPSGSVIQCLGLHSGKEHSLLKGHLDTVNCCSFNSSLQELYSGSNDCNIITWAPPENDALPEQLMEASDKDVDTWSD